MAASGLAYATLLPALPLSIRLPLRLVLVLLVLRLYGQNAKQFAKLCRG